MTREELLGQLKELRKEALEAGKNDIVNKIDQLGDDVSPDEITDIKMELDGWRLP